MRTTSIFSTALFCTAISCGIGSLWYTSANAQQTTQTPTVAPATLDATPENAYNSANTSIVRIHTTIRAPNIFTPWNPSNPQNATGTGVIIEWQGEPYILTNAHVVAYASRMYVQGHQDAARIRADVVAYAADMDLALLRISDADDRATFFETRPTLPLAENLPQAGTSVTAKGYPSGGTDLSTTGGIIFRIDVTNYNYGAIGLRIQVDAAINPGNSGGPAIVDDKIAGLVFAGITNADNIGFVIPCTEIQRFLTDAADGTYDGKRAFPNIGSMQTLENEDLRHYLNLTNDQTGLLVDPSATLPEVCNLQHWDIITHIAGHNIDNEGQCQITDDIRGSFAHFIDVLGTEDDTIELGIIRNGESMNIIIDIHDDTPRLLPQLQPTNDEPRYVVWGPLAFSQATQDLATNQATQYYLAQTASNSPLITRFNDAPAFDGEELIVGCHPLLDHAINEGYGDVTLQCLSRINGTEVRNLEHLIEIIHTIEDDTLIFEFEENSETLIYDRETFIEAGEKILEDNSIRYTTSKDLRHLMP